MKRLVLLLCISLISSVAVFASEDSSRRSPSDTAVTENFAIYYRFDDTRFDQTYLSNSETAARIKNYMINSPRIDSITIYAWASPEGAYHHNVWLSKERAKTARNFLLTHSPDSAKLNSDKIKISPLAENWPGLEKLVFENYHRHDREKVLKILRADNIGDETRKWRLKQLDGGYTWRYLLRNYMPKLRTATWICVWAEVIDPLEKGAIVAARAETKSPPLAKPSPISQIEEKTLLALKTNLLYDAVTALNFEIEVPIGERWSVAVEDVFPWWTWGPNRNKYAFQMWEIGVEPRYWFKKGEDADRLAGHFAGAYLMSSIYDFQYDKAICYQGEYWSAGLTYGYAVRIGDRLNLEASVSVGYLSSDYRHYQPDPEYGKLYADKFETGTMSYFGPTKLKVSLVLPICTTRTIRR